MSRRVALLFALLGLAVVGAPEAAAQKKTVKTGTTWKGSVEDEKAPQPDVVASAKALEALWKAWKIPSDAPKVDFAKEIVIGVYSRGSVLKLNDPELDEKGNLQVLGFGTRDLRPGFRYVLATVSRDGIKTVNGKDVPKE